MNNFCCVLGFLREVIYGLIAYMFQLKKPSLNLCDSDLAIFKQKS